MGCSVQWHSAKSMKSTKGLTFDEAKRRLSELSSMLVEDRELKLEKVQVIAAEARPLAEFLDSSEGTFVNFYLAMAEMKAGMTQEGTERLLDCFHTIGDNFDQGIALQARLVGIAIERGFVHLGTDLAYELLDEVEKGALHTAELYEGVEKVADALSETSRSSDARRFYLAAVEIARSLEDWSDIGPKLLRCVAWQEHDLNQCDMALQRALESWDIEERREAKGNTPEGCWTQILIAGIYEEMGRFQDAEQAHKKALSIATTLQDEELLDSVRNNYAVLLLLLGRYQESHNVLHQIHGIASGDYDFSEPEVSNLAEVYFGLGDTEKALQMNTEIIELEEEVDRKAPNRAYMVQGDMLSELGRFDEAAEQYEIALDIIHETLESNKKLLGEVMVGKGRNLVRKGEFDSAEFVLREACALLSSVFEGDHPRLAIGLRELGRALAAQGIEEGETVLKQALRMCLGIFGEEHQETILTKEYYSRIAEK